MEFHNQEKECLLSEILENNVDSKYYISEKTLKCFERWNNKSLKNSISQTLIADYWRMPSKESQVIYQTQLKNKNDIATTIPRWYGFQTTNTFILDDNIDKNTPLSQLVGKIRRLTPLECERLQGFPDNWTKGCSDTQRYRQCGNAVTVNVIKYIMENMIDAQRIISSTV